MSYRFGFTIETGDHANASAALLRTKKTRGATACFRLLRPPVAIVRAMQLVRLPVFAHPVVDGVHRSNLVYHIDRSDDCCFEYYSICDLCASDYQCNFFLFFLFALFFSHLSSNRKKNLRSSLVICVCVFSSRQAKPRMRPPTISHLVFLSTLHSFFSCRKRPCLLSTIVMCIWLPAISPACRLFQLFCCQQNYLKVIK